MSDQKLNNIKVIVPFYNPGWFFEMCVNSILTQNYTNFEVLFIDDASTDLSFEKIPARSYESDHNGQPVLENGEIKIIDQHPLLDTTKCKNITLWRASSRATPLPNIHNAIMQWVTDPEDIIVIVDGDDWLSTKNALTIVNDFYNENDCWLMYGSSQFNDGKKFHSSPYRESDFESDYRSANFRISPLRTFRAGLYHSIAQQDPEFKCMKDKKGNWFSMCYSMAVFYPLMEMAGFDKVKHNPKIIYTTNRDNPLCEENVNDNIQFEIEEEIIKRKKFKQIINYTR